MIVPEGKIAIGKLAQALTCGARVIALRGNFDRAGIVRALAAEHPIELVNSVNPHRIEGQKTAAFEVVEELGEAPGAIAIPVGNAGRDRLAAGLHRARERAAAVRVPGRRRGAIGPRRAGRRARHGRLGDPDRQARALGEAMAAFTDSRGRVEAVSDEQILDAYRLLATSEGIFCEPASAAAVAGILAYGLPAAPGGEPPASVVCVLTGHGPGDLDNGARHRATGGRLRR